MSQGYIKLHRQIMECSIWDIEEAYDKRSAWVELLLLANHKDKKTLFNNEMITIRRGQHLTSIRKLAERWGWSRGKVDRFLHLLENEQMVNTKRATSNILINIVNYDFYQHSEDEGRATDGHKTDHRRATDEPQTDTNKNDKNDKKERIYNAHFEDCWNIYLKKKDKARAHECYMARLQNGYSEEELFEATKNYMDECKKNNTPLQYIKDAKTFFGVNTPFVDYIPKKDPDGKNYENGLRVFNVEFPESEGPPFYGLPEDWFEDGNLNESKITKVQQPAMSQYGWYKPVEISEARIRELYKLRRSYFEGKSNG